MSGRSSIRIVAATAFAASAALTPGVAAALAPGNDDVADATSVTSIPFDDVVEVADATVEDGEPTETCAPFANTVWYAVSLAESADVYIDTAGSNYDTTLAVWTGSDFSDVELVTCVDDTFTELQAAAMFAAEPGVTYLVQVGAFAEAPPDAVLTISFGPPPKNNGKPLIFKNGIRGSMAQAYVDEYDETTGTYSSRGIQVLDGATLSKGMRSARLSQLNLSSYSETYDDATGTYSWTSWFGFADLAPDQFAIDRRLERASVEAELTLFGETCTDSPLGFECTPLGEAAVLVEVDWDGDGPLVRTRNRGAEGFDGARFRFASNVSSRVANVEGGATGDVALDFTGAYGDIMRGSDGSWSWFRGGAFFGSAATAAALADSTSTGGAPVAIDRFRGSFADAFDETYDEATNTYGYRQVSMMIGRSRSKGGHWYDFEGVSVSAGTQTYDEAAGTVTLVDWFGSGPLLEGSVERRLESASAVAEVTLFGYQCTFWWEDGTEECIFLGESTVMVDADWTGDGPVYTSRYSSDTMSGAEHLRFSGRSTSRGASADVVVTGEVVGWSGVDLPGSLSKSVDGSWYKS